MGYTSATTRLLRTVLRLVLGSRHPRYAGRIKVSTIHGDVTIARDENGIPHIHAAQENDAWFGLGFCHGQDRTFQLEMLRNIARGTLASVVGKDALGVDRLIRRMGIHRVAPEDTAIHGAPILAMLTSYVAGLNAGIFDGRAKRPHELVLLGQQSGRWELSDVVRMDRLQALLLAANWDSELARLKMFAEDGARAVSALQAPYPEWTPVTTHVDRGAGPAIDALAGDLAQLVKRIGSGGGSNNWALRKNKTATGRPFLANDPHLPSLVPCAWYLAHVSSDTFNAVGATFAGAPGFPAGHNGHAAWGITAALYDNTDLFIEEVGPDKRSVRRGESYVACEMRSEEIPVRGTEPFREDVLVTSHGPIISPALDDIPFALSMSATWLQRAPIDGLLTMHHARSFADARAKLEKWPGLPLNVVYADVNDDIGWQLTGRVPLRKKGNGAIPLPAADPEVGWHPNPAPYEQMPHLQNPASDFVATANQRPTLPGTAPFLGEDWYEGYRAARINEQLAERSDWDVASSARLQIDQLSIPWREIKDRVLVTPATSSDLQRALELLRSWDGVVSASSTAATVFEYFVLHFTRSVVAELAPTSTEWALGKGFNLLSPLTSLTVRRTGQVVRWIREQPNGVIKRPWADVIASALQSAMAQLKRELGANERDWAWGRVRPIVFEHAFTTKKPLAKIFNVGPIPWGGDGNTVSQASINPFNPTATPPFSASMRLNIDVGAWERSRFILPTGQSGNPCSSHYDDMTPLWVRGEGVAIAFTKDDVARATRHTLTLAT